MDAFMACRKSTLSLMQRAGVMSEEQQDAQETPQMPRFPITRAPNAGTDMVRLRLLCGMSALNATLSKWRDRSSKCPFGCCDTENTLSFLLHCKGVEGARTHFTGQLPNCCTCGNDEVVCAAFYDELEDADKALFILGGPVMGRVPERSIDLASKQFVGTAWQARCRHLTLLNPDPPEVDLTVGTRCALRHGQGISTRRDAGSTVPRRVNVNTSRRARPGNAASVNSRSPCAVSTICGGTSNEQTLTSVVPVATTPTTTATSNSRRREPKVNGLYDIFVTRRN